MKRLKYILIIFICLPVMAETLPLQKNLPYYSCVTYEANQLHYYGDSATVLHFYNKLDTLALFGKGKINIVHIGGSHVQADVFTNRLRQNLTTAIPGFIANRGLIFPFSVAKTNNPTNYSIRYNGEWTRTQNIRPPLDYPLGISGCAITTSDSKAWVSFDLNPEHTTSYWKYDELKLLAQVYDTLYQPILIIGNDTIDPIFKDGYYSYKLTNYCSSGKIILQKKGEKITIDTTLIAGNIEQTDSLNIGLESDNGIENNGNVDIVSGAPIITIRGILPQNNFNGLTIHSMGVNGASLPSWLRCSLLEDELKLIKPDLVILAVGVNDANVPYGSFDVDLYKSRYRQLIGNIQKVNPDCAIIFITNNDCVFRIGRKNKGYNQNTPLVEKALIELATEYGAALWNQFEIMGGARSVEKWVDAGLSNKDRVHFLIPGYNLLGDMLYNAIVYDWLYKR